MPDLSWLTARPVAHRGLHDVANGVVENTASAVQAAIDGDYGIEVDLQLTGDGEAVVFHDETLDRLTKGRGRVVEQTTPALQAVEFQDSTDRMQTLGELLDQVSGKVTLVLEIKSLWNNVGELERRVAEVVSGYSGPLAVMSFDPRSVAAMRQLRPELVRGMVSEYFPATEEWSRLTSMQRFRLRHLLPACRCRPHFINYHVKALPALAPAIARALGLPLLTWTVRTPEDRAIAEKWTDAMVFEGFRP